MRKWNLLFLFYFVARAQVPLENHYALLPNSEAKSIGALRTTWIPSKADVDNAEVDVSQVALLKAEGWGYAPHIEHPERYYRQYVPVQRAGRSLLYLNAFCEATAPDYWRKRLVIVSDGGTCFWQAYYDPATKRYSHLTINGRA